MSSTAPTIQPLESAPPRRTIRSAVATTVRWTLSLTFVAIGFFIVSNEGTIRVVEANMLAWLMNLGVANDAIVATSANNPAVAFEMGGQWLALRITVQCAIALYLGPILFLAALLLLSPRVSVGRVFLATAIGLASLTVLNQVRLLLIAFGYGSGGIDAFHWMHGPVGTALMLVGIAVVLFLFAILCIRKRPSPTHGMKSAVRHGKESSR